MKLNINYEVMILNESRNKLYDSRICKQMMIFLSLCFKTNYWIFCWLVFRDSDYFIFIEQPWNCRMFYVQWIKTSASKLKHAFPRH